MHYAASQVPFLDFNESEGEGEELGMDESLEDDGEIEGYGSHFAGIYMQNLHISIVSLVQIAVSCRVAQTH